MSEEEKLPEETTEEPVQAPIESSDPPDPKPRPVHRPPHLFWRGWWLAVILLGCIVVLGQEPPHLSDWLNPPLRPFAGGILLGCALGALPRVMRKRGGEAS